jgi:hypothetical protein
MSGYLLPPNNKTEVNLIQGMNDFKNYTLYNMSDIWYKMTEKTKKGDMILLGGDFVLPCHKCCFKNCKTKDDRLIDLMVKKLQEGVKIIILDDMIYIEQIYKEDKLLHDSIIKELEKESNGNFYHYIIPYPSKYHVYLHSKILTVFYLNDIDRQYVTSCIGSFNPSYPISLTNEIGIYVTGLISNSLIQAIGSYMLIISKYINELTENGEKYNEPLEILGKYFDTDTNYKRKIKTNINFIGKDYTSNANKYIKFSEKNVEFKLAGEPSNIFNNFYYGMDLIKDLFSKSKRFVKIAIMQGVVEQLPYCDSDFCAKGSFDRLLFNDELMKFLKEGKEFYVIQKEPKKNVNKNGTFGPEGGLWGWLENNGRDCKRCSKTPLDIGLDGEEVIRKNQISVRWCNYPIHWKLYMSDNEIIQSTQHPIQMFYYQSQKRKKTTLGYDLSIRNCPRLIRYYNDLFNYYWKNFSIKPKFNLNSPNIIPNSDIKSDGRWSVIIIIIIMCVLIMLSLILIKNYKGYKYFKKMKN